MRDQQIKYGLSKLKRWNYLLKYNNNEKNWSKEEIRSLFDDYKRTKGNWQEIIEKLNNKDIRTSKKKFFSIVRGFLKKVFHNYGDVKSWNYQNKIYATSNDELDKLINQRIETDHGLVQGFNVLDLIEDQVIYNRNNLASLNQVCAKFIKKTLKDENGSLIKQIERLDRKRRKRIRKRRNLGDKDKIPIEIGTDTFNAIKQEFDRIKRLSQSFSENCQNQNNTGLFQLNSKLNSFVSSLDHLFQEQRQKKELNITYLN